MAGSADAIIVGGGVIGCAVAWELARNGVGVVLLESGEIGGEASGASAGLVLPRRSERTPLDQFYTASIVQIPELVAELEESTGLCLEYYPSGSIQVATSEAEEEELQQVLIAWCRTGQAGIEWADYRQVHGLEPALGPQVRCGLVSEGEASLHPGRLTQALARAAAQHGACIRTGCPVIGVRHSHGRFAAVNTPEGEMAAGELVVAAGAWSGTICRWLGVDIPIGPNQGQMLALRPRSRVLYRQISAGVTISPRLDGTVYIGATSDQVGFDRHPTPAGLAYLLARIPQVLPVLQEAAFERCWAGLRPGCADGLPVIGRLPGWEGVTLASGHGGGGIMMCQITAQVLKKMLVDGQADPLAAPFSPDRFAAAVAVRRQIHGTGECQDYSGESQKANS